MGRWHFDAILNIYINLSEEVSYKRGYYLDILHSELKFLACTVSISFQTAKKECLCSFFENP